MALNACLRWRGPDGSVDRFDDLLAVAEETGLSITLGRETMEAVCWQLRSWRNTAPQVDILLSVNLTQRQFYNPDMVLQLATDARGQRRRSIAADV